MFYSEAMALYKRSNFEDALKKVICCLELDPDFAAGHILLSKIGSSQTCQKYELEEEYTHKKRLQETIDFLEGSIELLEE